MQRIIGVRNLTKRFGDNIVLDDINFDIEDGSIFGLIGKSGCGKTTLLNILVGFLKPNKGNIYYRDTELRKLGSVMRKTFGFAAQDSSFYRKLTVVENLNYFGKLYGLSSKEIKERTKTLLDTFDLTEAANTFGENLSIGMQKRLDIACALIHKPAVLILDEPTANLDPLLRKNILDLIKKINESWTTVIISSHILEDISALCHNVIVIDNKRIVAMDSPKNLEKKFSGQKVIRLESELKDYTKLISTLSRYGLLSNYKLNGDSLMLQANDIKNTLKCINYHFSNGKDSLVSINIAKPSLDLFFESLEKKGEG